MSEKEQNKLLFTEFPPVGTQAWEDVITKDLKGADYDKKLIWKTIEGFNVKPYYRAEDVQNLPNMNTLPGEFPYIRSGKTNSNEWYIRQDIKVENPKQANAKALDILMRGATSVGFEIGDGCAFTEEDFAILMQDIHPEAIEINFTANCGMKNLVLLMANYIKKTGKDAAKIEGSMDFDPIGRMVQSGILCQDEVEVFNIAKTALDNGKSLPNFRIIAVRGDHFHNAGSTLVQELAFALSVGVEYLNNLTEKGFTADELASKMKFTFAVGSNYFMEIAKFRAARLLWAKLLGAYGVKAENSLMNIHAVTSRWNKSMYDAYVNMLRTTTEAMSAAIAGVNSITVEPFNKIYENTTEFSERISRNQQIVLKEEAYFDKIVDPSAGSYYIENLTNSLVEEAWKLFLTVEEKDGFFAAFKAGFIQSEIKAIAKKRDMNIATRRDIILGVNQYPNFNEKAAEGISYEDLQSKKVEITGVPFGEALLPYRGAQAFEELRLRTDRAAIRPKVFMFTFGNVAMRRARALFACNFFACAGFEVIDTNGFPSLDEGVKAVFEQEAAIVVLCSGDDEYATVAPEVFEKIGGKAIVVVAGAPACADELKAKGISNFINVKSNVLETLQSYQTQLGIK